MAPLRAIFATTLLTLLVGAAAILTLLSRSIPAQRAARIANARAPGGQGWRFKSSMSPDERPMLVQALVPMSPVTVSRTYCGGIIILPPEEQECACSGFQRSFAALAEEGNAAVRWGARAAGIAARLATTSGSFSTILGQPLLPEPAVARALHVVSLCMFDAA